MRVWWATTLMMSWGSARARLLSGARERAMRPLSSLAGAKGGASGGETRSPSSGGGVANAAWCGGVPTGMRSRRALAFTSGAALLSGLRGGRRLLATMAPPETTTSSSGHESFRLVREERIVEYAALCRLYEHESTKAQVLSIAAEDENKVFGITFRTPPRDSTGLPHILEHSVLCGSEKYPTKEPFVELLKGSLQTFLNAFTYPDRTCYPVASQNAEDLKNLARVYMDAVFFPRARRDPRVLAQEGWHYEVDENEELSYKGVVYNEMKGVYSSPDALMSRAAQQALFPDNAYRHDSGGDPERIPDLTFDDFAKFHDEFYHPSNARVFVYGDVSDVSEAERLALVADYLDRFEKGRPEETAVGRQPRRFDEPLSLRVPFPGGADAKHMLTVNWLVADEPLAPTDELALAVLDHLLVGTSTSLLRKALTESGLGESVAGGGLSDELVQPTFSIGMKGVAAEDAAKVEALVVDALANARFSDEDVAASMNTIEFELREFNTGSFPKGLSFMLGCMRNWIYDRDPLEPLKFEAPLAELKTLASPDYFKQLTDRFLTHTTHRVTVEMVPDADLEAQQVESERARLAAAEVDKAAVRRDAAELERIQSEPDAPEALATIPTLKVADLEPAVRTIPRLETRTESGVVVLSRDLPTAGIAYVDVALDLTALPLADVELVPLFARCLLETGVAGKYDAVQLQRQIGARTGGIDASVLNTMRLDGDAVADPEDLVYRLVLRGKATLDKTDDLLALMADILANADFSQHQRMIEMLKESKARYESAFRTSGNAFAASRLAARLTRSGYCAELTGGVTHYRSVLRLLEENDMPALQRRLEAMRDALLAAKDPVINLTADRAVDLDALAAVLDPRPDATRPDDWAATPLFEHKNEGFAVPTQVNYVAKGGRFYAPGEPVSGADAIVRRVISLDYLWNEVRVKGGAYGGGCSLNPITGTFAFSSYRDPNLDQTLKIYDATPDYLADLDLSQSELDKAVIAEIGQLDFPLTADQKGYLSLRHYLDGTTDDARQKFRDQVLATTLADFDAFGAKLKDTIARSSEVVFASADALKAANDNLKPEDQLDVVTLL